MHPEYIIKCKCGIDFPTFTSEAKAKQFAEQQLDSMLRMARENGEDVEAKKAKHIYNRAKVEEP